MEQKYNLTENSHDAHHLLTLWRTKRFLFKGKDLIIWRNARSFNEVLRQFPKSVHLGSILYHFRSKNLNRLFYNANNDFRRITFPVFPQWFCLVSNSVSTLSAHPALSIAANSQPDFDLSCNRLSIRRTMAIARITKQALFAYPGRYTNTVSQVMFHALILKPTSSLVVDTFSTKVPDLFAKVFSLEKWLQAFNCAAVCLNSFDVLRARSV